MSQPSIPRTITSDTEGKARRGAVDAHRRLALHDSRDPTTAVRVPFTGSTDAVEACVSNDRGLGQESAEALQVRALRRRIEGRPVPRGRHSQKDSARLPRRMSLQSDPCRRGGGSPPIPPPTPTAPGQSLAHFAAISRRSCRSRWSRPLVLDEGSCCPSLLGRAIAWYGFIDAISYLHSGT